MPIPVRFFCVRTPGDIGQSDNTVSYTHLVGACTTVLFYNKDMLDAAGLDYPTAETTWEELSEMAEKLTVRDADGVPTTIGLSTATGNWLNVLFSKGGKFLDDMNNPTEVVFESPEALETLELSLIHISLADAADGQKRPCASDIQHCG